jgi:hypothetical protein
VQEAIEEIIIVQEDKAEYRDIKINLELIGFGINFNVWTDRYRLQ